MSLLFFPTLFLLLQATVLTAAAVRSDSSAVAQPAGHACGTIVNDPDGSFVFNASDVYACLTSVPFNSAVASKFIDYYNDTIGFQTVQNLNSPPSSYRQPSIDLMAGLQQLQDASNSNSFANQYEFEVALQRLLMAAHDGHLYLQAGILSAFSFGSPYDIVTLSVDGSEVPKVYLAGDTITFDSENGTSITDKNLGIYWSQGPTGPLETGGDFYNFFVLGFYPASFDFRAESGDSTGDDASSSTTPVPTASTSATPTPSSWNSPAYPEIPDIAQPDLGTYGGGFLSAYFLNSTSVSVLSIPSFDEFDAALNTFQATVDEFIKRSKQAGLQKVVIDLQGNTGGQVLLAFDTFRRFFPDIEPFAGSHLRAHHPTDVSSTRLSAETGANFTSWEKFFGPVTAGDDRFTTTQRFNLTSQVFIEESIDSSNFNVSASTTATASPPWAPEDILLLTDGVCSSSCALFVEMMHQEAGVRTVALGGRPVSGPMQGVGGTRSARVMATETLDANIGVVQVLLENSTDSHFLPNRTEALDVYIVDAGINLRDQVRKGETQSLQFAYEPADCRIYFTPQTVFNYTNLWNYAANAIWRNSSLCVEGSTGLAGNSTSTAAYIESSTSGPGIVQSDQLHTYRPL
ncbi:hypothetical protein F5Y15DRAFT_416991 [Xylariaceae sp. FL0016]|nr:hypothetical protein F5Y15DRAFT_416991 [Xylariaceae sp. FL0016]